MQPAAAAAGLGGIDAVMRVRKCMQGRPVYIQLIGKINLPAIMAVSNEERLFKFHVQVRWSSGA